VAAEKRVCGGAWGRWGVRSGCGVWRVGGREVVVGAKKKKQKIKKTNSDG